MYSPPHLKDTKCLALCKLGGTEQVANAGPSQNYHPSQRQVTTAIENQAYDLLEDFQVENNLTS